MKKYNSSKKSQWDAQTYFYLAMWLLLIAGVFGFFKNIYELTQCDFQSPFKCEAVHGVGLIPIFGAITGYIDTDEK